jgi:hypothetical protein
MKSGREGKVLDPNITLELTPDEITVVDAIELEAFESGSFFVVQGAPPSPPGARETESEDQRLDGNVIVEQTLDDDPPPESAPPATLRMAEVQTK